MSDRSLEERLGDLLAVTDVRLTRLDVDDLLVEVLERLRSILDVDTAAVLLRQHDDDDHLVARAARGLEDEVRQGVRVPIGAGFAGTIAARREPVVLDRIDATTVANPVLWRTGIRRMVGVPLLVGSQLLGVLHVGRLEDRAFTEYDVELLQVAGERVAAAVQTRRLAVEAAASSLLERELMPTRLPVLPGLRFASRYAPAEDRSIGGDWYDAFVLPSGQLWVLIGDVAGHGLSSAVMVSRVRSAIRSYALLGSPVTEVLERTNRKLLHFETHTMVTALVATSEPPFEHFVMSSAGHLPPVRATPDGAELVQIKPGPPLGVLPDARYSSTTTTLPARSTLLLYTDGLVERRGEAVDVGLRRLQAATENGPPDDVCRDVMLQLVGSTSTLDDVALLAIGRTEPLPQPAPEHDELRLIPQPDSVARARDFALDAAGAVPPSIRAVLKLLVSELATNCVVHAASEFTVRLVRETDRLRVECSDLGGGTVRRRDAEPDDTHGRGVSFVQELADEWGIDTPPTGPGKTVWFVLRLDRPDGAGLAAGHDSGVLVLELSGELDVARANGIVARGSALLEEAEAGGRLIVDLSRVGFIDSSGLSGLLRLRRVAVARDVAMSLRGVPPEVAAVLLLSGLDQVLPSG